jgi:hypothetical protein
VSCQTGLSTDDVRLSGTHATCGITNVVRTVDRPADAILEPREMPAYIGYVITIQTATQTRRLEVHHRQPFAEGEPPTAQNLTLTCVAHNRLEAARWFGEDFDQSKSRLAQASPCRPGG